jgi:eukaryotic-like serine/threonine-protein kinase
VFTRFAKILLYVTIFMVAAGAGAYFSIHLLIRSDNRVIVPDLVSKDVVYALEVLSDLGLNTKVKKSEYHPIVPKHHIIDQYPDPGTEIKRGRDVRLMISKGARSVIFPNVMGMDISMAGIIIEENDLHQGSLSYTYSRTQPKGRILSQSPKAGTKGTRGDTIDILISSGPKAEWLRMMDLKDLGFDEAIETIEKHQLAVGTITHISSSTLPLDAVVTQDPKAGFPVLPGKTVDLTINRPNQKVMGSRGRDVSLFRYRVDQGFLRQRVRVRINRADAAMDIYNDFAKAGEEVWLIIFRDAPTALFLYLDDELIITKHYD